MRNVLLVSLILSFALAGACNRGENAVRDAETAVALTELSPEQLGEIGGQIKKEPNRANEILTAHGLNEQSFEAAIRRVTEDPDASKRYAAAFQKASA